MAINSANNHNNGGNNGNGMQHVTIGGGGKNKNSAYPTGCYSINELAKKGLFAPLAYRDDEIREMVTTLMTKNTPNIFLLGEAGVGKTALVEEIARLRVTNDTVINTALGGVEFVGVNFAQLMAGTVYRGQLEERIQEIIEFASNDYIVLFFDEIHQFNHSQGEGGSSIIEMIKPELASGKIRVIAATTMNEAKDLQKDPAIRRRFKNIVVPELTNAQIMASLPMLIAPLEQYHKGRVDPTLYPFIVEMSERIKDIKRPANVISLIDKAFAIANGERLYDVLNNTSLSQQMRDSILSAPMNVQKTHIEESTQQMVNNVKSVNKVDPQTVEQEFFTTIVGQDNTLHEIVDMLQRKSLNLYTKERPLSMLLTGATGVGKTETAKLIGRYAFGNNNIITINMTEFTTPYSINKLIGSPRGYIGSNSKQPLPLDELQTKRQQVVLLDEIEKAHPDVQRLFMQALDEGYIRDNSDTVIPFHEAIIIATTNAGVQELTKRSVGFSATQSEPTKEEIVAALSKTFPPELINRFEHVFHYNNIDKDQYKVILKRKFNNTMKEVMKNRNDIDFDITHIEDNDDVAFINQLADDTYNKLQNARPADRTIKNYIETCVLEQYQPSTNVAIKSRVEFNQ